MNTSCAWQMRSPAIGAAYFGDRLLRLMLRSDRYTSLNLAVAVILVLLVALSPTVDQPILGTSMVWVTMLGAAGASLHLLAQNPRHVCDARAASVLDHERPQGSVARADMIVTSAGGPEEPARPARVDESSRSEGENR